MLSIEDPAVMILAATTMLAATTPPHLVGYGVVMVDAVATEPSSSEKSTPLWHAPAAVGAVAASGCALFALWNPSDSGTSVCWSKSVLGIDCPFCGGLRCVNAFMHGHPLQAADHNVVLAVALPLLAAFWTVWMVRSLRGESFRMPHIPRWVIATGIGALLAFTVARNVGGAPWIDWLNSSTYRA